MFLSLYPLNFPTTLFLSQYLIYPLSCVSSLSWRLELKGRKERTDGMFFKESSFCWHLGGPLRSKFLSD